jgi:maltose alpha-D-glucosyltransferase / alpha-amylase
MTDDTFFERDLLWYKDAVIYQLHVKSFFDANNDGIGDFAGLLDKLDYITDLGVTAIWLLPFYPSPRRDDGYDIAEYRDVSSDYGTLEELRAFIDAAHERGLRIITELVINHTSDQHPWFQASRKAPAGSPEREFYVWSDNDQLYSGTRIIFLDTEKSNWTWDEEAQAYFWHRFYSHQPDLNFDNPAVLDEVLSVMDFWCEAGVDGLRLDAIPYLIERDGTSNENLPETHAVLKKIRAHLDAKWPGKMLLAEANMWPEDTQQYFGDVGADGLGDECHMAFHFPLMPRMYMGVAQEDRFPITDIMRQTPDIPANCQWAIFLRNHDELTLEMVTDAERDYLWKTYASDRRARINLGIRRRLSPLMEHDRSRIELMNWLLLTMPGTPVLYYGDEIGMGDNIFLGDRDGVRTPMQWTPDRNGGFSKADPAALTLPLIMDPLYGFQSVNVEAQQRDRHSLLSTIKRMLAVRRQYHAFGRGAQRFLRPANRKIIAYLREFDEESVLCVANLSRTAQAVELDLSEFEGRTPIELSGGTAFPGIGQLPYLLTLPPYAFLWFTLSAEESPPEWSSGAPEMEVERHTFVIHHGLEELGQDHHRSLLESQLLPEYIPQRRWFGSKDAAFRSARILRSTLLPNAADLLLTQVEIETERDKEIYNLPFGIAWEGAEQGPFASNLALARLRRGRTVGLLTDGFTLASFPCSILTGLRDGLTLPFGEGELRFNAFPEFDVQPGATPEWLSAEQSNSSVMMEQQAVLKLLRRIQPGVHPDLEMIRHLTTCGFANVPPMLGEVVQVEGPDTSVVMMVQRFVYNQGDGWQWTLGVLERLATAEKFTFSNYENFAAKLGARLSEMHEVLARDSEDEAFAPVPVDAAYADELVARVVSGLDRASRLIQDLADDGVREIGQILVDRRSALVERLNAVAQQALGRMRTRVHGDLHLGQLLVTGNDVMFIDFEGEPARSMDERRAKDLAIRDVAGILRSFDYAGAVAERARPAAADSEETRTEERFARFREAASLAFLNGYTRGGETMEDPLLDLFLIDKAAYEVAYEAANRPDWMHVPVAGLVRAATRILDRTEQG